MGDRVPVWAWASPGETAKQLASHLRQTDPQRRPWTAMPYNRHRPEQSEWYVLPTAVESRRAFRLGKVLLRWLDGGGLFAGLYVEKGLAVAAPVLKEWKVIPPEAALDPSWTWHRLQRAMGDGTFAAVVAGVAAQAKADLFLHLAISQFVAPPLGQRAEQADWKQYLQPCGHICWRLEGGHLRDPVHTGVQGPCGPLLAAQHLLDLSRHLQTLPDEDLYWVDLSVGFHFRPPGAANVGDPCRWSAQELATYAALPWAEWLG